MSDDYLVSIAIPPPLEGVWEGLDPALDDRLFSPTRAADLLNVRCAGGRWETRAGSGSEFAFATPNSGATRLFDVLYEAAGGRFRLIARGEDNTAKLYDLEVGVDSAWQAVSGGTGLGTTTFTEPYFAGTQVGDGYYLTDRINPLKKYTPVAGLVAVTIPTAPIVAPRAKPRTYGVLDAFTGGGTLGWTESDSGNFDIASGTADVGLPMGDAAAKIDISGSGARNDTIKKDVPDEAIESHTIAWWYWSGIVGGKASLKRHIQLGIGLAGPDEQIEVLYANTKNEWYPYFMNVGNLGAINFKRFKAIRALTSQTFYLTELLLPGRLQGIYRWVYTHFNPTTGHESGISPMSNGGEPLDFSAVGVSRGDSQAAAAAFKKSCMLDFTSDAGSDAGTTKIRIYRSGGVPELTLDQDGRSLWLRVGEINDTTTELAGAHLATDTTLAVDSHVGFAEDDWIVVAKGTATEEYHKVVSAAASVLTITEGLAEDQLDNAAVQIAFLDNVGNEAIDVLTTVDEERSSPPSGSDWVARAPDGRLWLFGPGTRIAVSNKATPLRPVDFECFPTDVDPQTRSSPTQGFTVEIGGDSSGEFIVWGGFHRGLPHILTRNKLFRVNALSQSDWGPNAIQKVLDVGCIAGESVQQEGGFLYWVSEGPRVVRWDGEGPVEVLSHQRVNVRLEVELAQSGTSNARFWFARVWENQHGRYYSLWHNYSDGEGCLDRLDYNLTQGAWEPCRWLEGNGERTAFNSARVWDGGEDGNDLIAVTYRGAILDMDVGDNDRGGPIPFSATTKRMPLGFVGQVHELFIRLEAKSDAARVTITAGGSDYGTTTGTYTIDLAGSGDKDIWVPVERTVKGRWVEITLAGDFSKTPAVREMVLFVKPLRERQSADV